MKTGPSADDYVADPRRWRALSVCLTAGFMTLLDVSIVNVALPSISRSLHASDSELQWIVSGYALTFGLVLVAAGRLGDARGRRTMFVVGVALFTLSSIAAGFAPTSELLVVARLVQGVGGGIINPQVSGLIQELFRGAERGRAFGTYGAVIGVSTAIGPVLGGILIGAFGVAHGWRWIFFVNVPIGVLAIVLSYRLLPPPHPPATGQDRGWDPIGVLLLGGGVLALLWPLVSENLGGRNTLWFVAGAILLAIFVAWERFYARRGREPMVDLSLFKISSYTTGSTLALTYFAGFTGIFFVLTLFFQDGLGYSPLLAGLSLTTFAVGSAVSSGLSGRYLYRTGRKMVVIGLVLVIGGLVITDAVIALWGDHAALGWCLAAPLLVAGVGSGLVISPNQTLTLAEVPVPRAGTAGGVLQTGQRMGTAAGIAAVGAVYFGALRSQATPAHAVSVGLRLAIALTCISLVIGLWDWLVLRRRDQR